MLSTPQSTPIARATAAHGRDLGKRAFFALTLLISVIFTYCYFHRVGVGQYEAGSYQRLANFTADKVFQRRILVVLLAKMFVPALPALNTMFKSVPGFPLVFRSILEGWCVVFVAWMVYGFGALVRSLGTPRLTQGMVFAVLIPAVWDYMFLNWLYYPYDMASLAFFCWAIALYRQRRFGWFYLLYAAACINRESICFATVAIFAIELQLPVEMPRHNWLVRFFTANVALFIHCATQTALWCAIQYTLQYIFRNNPGSYYEETSSAFGFLHDIWTGEPRWEMHNPRMFLTLFAGIWILIPIFWRYIPIPTRKLLWVVPPYMTVAILFGNLMEVRIFNELNIVVAALAVAGLSGFISGRNEKADVMHRPAPR